MPENNNEMDLDESIKKIIEIQNLIRQGLARPDEKNNAFKIAKDATSNFTDDIFKRRAEKEERNTGWSVQTHDGFVASSEASQLDGLLNLLKEYRDTFYSTKNTEQNYPEIEKNEEIEKDINNFGSKIFISYNTKHKNFAGKIKESLYENKIDSFLAHEDLEVSTEWKIEILEALKKSNVFIILLSSDYYESPWCYQESGIIAYLENFRDNVTIIPISIDGTIPKGFIGHRQSKPIINMEEFDFSILLPGLFIDNPDWVVNFLIKKIEGSGSFRNAENNFEKILPYLGKMNKKYGKKLLEVCVKNDQIYNASLCIGEYISKAIALYGDLLSKEDLDFLNNKIEAYK